MQSKLMPSKTLRLALVLFTLISSLGEIVARSSTFRAHAQAPHYGGQHGQFELQLARMEAIAEQEGPIDCLFLGSSVVWLGIVPQVFSTAYEQETGEHLRCFNFGVSAMPVVSSAAVARILVEKYKPKLLIIGTTPRDFAVPETDDDARAVLDTPYVQYHMGHFSVNGWLYSHSYLYRYRAALHKLLQFDSAALELDLGQTPQERYGFLPKDQPPNKANIEGAKVDADKWLVSYEMQPYNLAALEQLLNLNRPGQQLILIEMPVTEEYFDYFPKGRVEFDRYMEQLKLTVSALDVPLWTMTDREIIQEDGFWDNTHLNAVGAEQISDWLGHQIGQAVENGQLMTLRP